MAKSLLVSETTNYVATAGNPFVPSATCSLTNPFPSGIQQQIGNSLGALTGVGGDVSLIDARSRLPHLHRYSMDVRRELGDAWMIGAGYLGARGENLVVGGANGGSININQLDARYLTLGTSLQEPVANPFFGTPLGVGMLAGTTVPRGQLLRPYPQFDTVSMTRSPVARSRYHAVVLSGERRMRHGWSMAANYTWSRRYDNMFHESAGSFAGGSTILDNYDIEREYGLSVLDTPHRLNITATVALPLGWTVSAVGMYQSGYPITVQQSPNNSGLFGSNQRPNLVPGGISAPDERFRRLRSDVRLHPLAQSRCLVAGRAVHVRQRAARRRSCPHADAAVVGCRVSQGADPRPRDALRSARGHQSLQSSRSRGAAHDVWRCDLR